MKIQAWLVIDTHGCIVDEVYFTEGEAFEQANEWDRRRPEDAPHKAYKIENVRLLDCYRKAKLEQP